MYRYCEMDEETGVQWSNCSDWIVRSIEAARGVGDESYGGYSAYTFDQGWSQKLREVLFSMDGRDGWYRICDVDGSQGIQWDRCGVWESLRGEGSWPDIGDADSGAYSTYGTYTFVQNGQVKFQESVYSMDKKVGWYHVCNIGSNGRVNWGECNRPEKWTRLVLGDIPNLEPEEFTAYGAYFNVREGKPVLQQSLLTGDGKKGWYRGCKVKADGSVDFNRCSYSGSPDVDPFREENIDSYSGSWREITMGDVSGFSELMIGDRDRYQAYGAFTFESVNPEGDIERPSYTSFAAGKWWGSGECWSLDLKCDGDINIYDLLEWRSLWMNQDTKADLNDDGRRDVLDYLVMLLVWLRW